MLEGALYLALHPLWEPLGYFTMLCVYGIDKSESMPTMRPHTHTPIHSHSLLRATSLEGSELFLTVNQEAERGPTESTGDEELDQTS